MKILTGGRFAKVLFLITSLASTAAYARLAPVWVYNGPVHNCSTEWDLEQNCRKEANGADFTIKINWINNSHCWFSEEDHCNVCMCEGSANCDIAD